MEFMFSIPSLVHFAPGVSKKTGEIIAGMGLKKTLFVYDQGVKAAGLVDSVGQVLRDAGLDVTEYADVLPNPPDYIVEQAAEQARAAGIEAIVALGGGSSIDCAKAINILLTNPSPINQYDGIGLVTNPTRPLLAIPTTAGTASEVTAFTIITDTERKKKMVIGGPFVGATIAIADPELTFGLPPAITASTGMDALTHAIEAYVSKGAMLPTDINALKAIELIAQNIVRAFRNGQDLEARENMLLGSMLAGFAFNSAVLGLVHSIAHPLSVHCGLPHGVANACVLPHVMEYNIPASASRMKDIAVALGLDVSGLSDEAAASKAVERVKELNQELEIPTLCKLDVSKEQFDCLADDALKEISTLFNPRDPNKDDVLAILDKAY